MHTERSYTHPLSGTVHGAQPVSRSEGSPRWHVYAVLAVALLLGAVAAGGCVALEAFAQARKAREALRQAEGKVEYEPLSKVGDGSYEESAGGGKARSLGVLRRQRSRM